MDVVEDFTGEEVAFPGLEIATLIKDAPTALEDEALFKEASPSLWEQHVASCLTLLLLILADAPLAEENLDKQVVPGCSCTLFCFADEVFTSSSQEQIVAARLASRPLLPTGVAEASERDGLGGRQPFPLMALLRWVSFQVYHLSHRHYPNNAAAQPAFAFVF